ncbi:MAG: hypothetical protein QCH99_08515 [Candidatus Bathyarchaeota archaeon]|nr:hypothetical protein [Candidatus Bathyarchaeum tardum]WGM89916.1 MAG: hypothetical protein NUK63_02005 [Candidatus Bathyarchaeum tardum]
MNDKREEVIDEAISKMSQIKNAAGEFKENVADLVKDANIESTDWRFNVESHKEGVTIDIAIRLLITKKEHNPETSI